MSPSSDFSPGAGISHSNGTGGEHGLASTPASTRRKSPGSPTVSRFMNSSLVKNFGRRISGTGPNASPPASPRHPDVSPSAQQDDVPPPLPPKDGAVDSSGYTPYVAPSQTKTPSEQTTDGPPGGAGNHLSSNYMGTQALSSGNGRPSSAGRSLGHGGGISPSPSAKTALAEASQKSVKSEMEIQERFRRDQEQKLQEEAGRRVASNPGAEEDADEEEGLPYDRPDPDETLHTTSTTAASPGISNAREVDKGDQAKEITPHQGLAESEIAHTGTEEKMMALNLAETGAAGAGAVMLAETMVRPEEIGRNAAKDVPEEVSPESATGPTATINAEGSHLQPQATNAPLVAAETTSVDDVAEKEAEELRLKEIRDADGKRAEEARRLEAERIAEEQRLREEDQVARQLREEKEAAEQRRIQEEREAEQRRLLEMEAEERRMKEEQEAEHRLIQEEREAEQRRLQVEKVAEEKRIKEEKEMQERRRRETVRSEMMRGKQSGVAMLSGVSDKILSPLRSPFLPLVHVWFTYDKSHCLRCYS